MLCARILLKENALLFPKTHMTRRMAGCVYYFNKEVSNINNFITLQHFCRPTLKEFIRVDIITFRQITSVNDHAVYQLYGQRKFT